MKNNHLDDLVKDTYRYFYIDGLVELAVGLLFTAIGLSLLGWVYTDPGTIWRVAAVLLLPLLTIGGVFGLKRVVQLIKERVTFQRTGYVRYKSGQPTTGRWLVPLLALALTIALWFVPAELNKMAAVQGTLLALILGFIGYRVRLTRFYVIAAAALLVGIGSSYLIANELVGSMVTYVVTGLIMAAVGGITLVNYLRQHPAVDYANGESL